MQGAANVDGIKKEDVAVAGVIRVKGHAEQSALAAGVDGFGRIATVEESSSGCAQSQYGGSGGSGSSDIRNHAQEPAFLTNEDTLGVAGR